MLGLPGRQCGGHLSADLDAGLGVEAGGFGSGAFAGGGGLVELDGDPGELVEAGGAFGAVPALGPVRGVAVVAGGRVLAAVAREDEVGGVELVHEARPLAEGERYA